MLGKRWIDYTVYLLVRLLISVVQALRIETCQVGARLLAMLFSNVLNVRGQVTAENLRQAYPDLEPEERERLALAMWEHLFLMVTEIAHARRKIHITNWHQYIRFQGGRRTAQILLEDRPTIVVSGHYGNFELAGYFLGLFGFATYTIARPLDNPYLDRFLNRFRATTGQYVLPTDGSGKRISLLLQRGVVLGLLGDQHALRQACWVKFFGRPASAHKAVAVFSHTADAPLLVTGARRLDRPLHYETILEAVADPRDPEFASMSIKDLTQWYTDHLQAIINRAPEQYWWLHRRWKGEPAQRRRLKAKSTKKVAA